MFDGPMIKPDMRVLVRGDKDHTLIGQVVDVISTEELPKMFGADGAAACESMRKGHITHLAAIVYPIGTTEIALFRAALKDGEWYVLSGGEHVTIEIVGVHRG